MTWGEASVAYQKHCLGLGRSAGTVRIVASWLQHFSRFCAAQGVEEPSQVTSSHVAAYRASLSWAQGARGKLFSPSSQARALESVRAFFRWAVTSDLVLLDPTAGLVVRRVTPLHRLLLTTEVAAMLAVPDVHTVLGLRDRAVLETLYATGIRRRECWLLDLDDLDLAEGTLLIRRGKGGKSRLLPVTSLVAAVLADYLARARPALLWCPAETAMFLSRDGLRFSYASIGKIVRDCARKAGLGRPVGPHALRHAVASHLLEREADLREVQELLGHEHLQSTQIYTHLNPINVKKEHERTHPRAHREPPGEDVEHADEAPPQEPSP